MINPFRYLLAFIRFIILITSLAVVLIPYILLTKTFVTNTPKLAFRMRRFWVHIACFILGIRVKFEGEMPNINALVVSNHRSFCDPLIVSKRVNAYVIAKAEVAKLPLISTGAQMTGIIYVQRDNKSSRYQVREKMVEVLLAGQSVMVYPEGTTNPNKQALPYKKGTFEEAAKNNIPILPLVIEYKAEKDIWYHGNIFVHYFQQFGYLTTDCRCVIGPLIKANEGSELHQLTEEWTAKTITRIHNEWDSFYSTHQTILDENPEKQN